jgi:hypothetical protein
VVVGVAEGVGAQTDVVVGLPSLLMSLRSSFCSGSLLSSASFACPERRRARAGRGDVGVGLVLRSSTKPGSDGRLSTCVVTRKSGGSELMMMMR